MKIKLKKKSVYGNDLLYPVCETAKQFAKLLETKTITQYALICISQLGYKIEIEG